LAFVMLFAAPAAANEIVLQTDQAEIVRLPAPAATLVIGNPSIADAAIYDRSTLIFTGRAYGRTNVIALDSRGRVIFARDVVVTQSGPGRLTLYRGAGRETLSCAPDCQPAHAVGDSDSSFSRLTSQQSDRVAQGMSAAGGGAQNLAGGRSAPP